MSIKIIKIVADWEFFHAFLLFALQEDGKNKKREKWKKDNFLRQKVSSVTLLKFFFQNEN